MNKITPCRKPPATPIGMIDGIPVFLVSESRPNRDFPGALIVSFRCPCGRTHSHSWQAADDPHRPQHRVAHCDAARPLFPRGYYIVARADAVDAGEQRADEPTTGTAMPPTQQDARQAASETSPVTRVTELSEHSSSSQETEPCHHGAGSATGRRQGIAVGQHERSDVEPGIGTADAPTRQIERQAGKVGPE